MKHIIFCSAVMATFIIDNPQCGGNRVERAQIAAIYLENSHHNQALLEARRALREEGPQAELQLIIALAHMGMEEDSAALEVLVNAIELDPANDQLHGALRSLCEKEAIRAEARSALIKLRNEMPPHAAMLATAAWIELQLAQEARSMALLDSAIALDPNYLHARVERSRMARKNADLVRAESDLREALRIAPNQPRLLIALGEILLKQTHTASADSAFAQALLHGNSINIAALIAHTYSEQNHAERAIEYYEHAIERARVRRGLRCRKQPQRAAPQVLRLRSGRDCERRELLVRAHDNRLPRRGQRRAANARQHLHRRTPAPGAPDHFLCVSRRRARSRPDGGGVRGRGRGGPAGRRTSASGPCAARPRSKR